MLIVPSISSASVVLAGIHDFDGILNTEGHDYAYSGFSGNVVETIASKDIYGSNDGRYGNQDPSAHENYIGKENDLAYAGPVLGPIGGDGALVADMTHPFTFAVTNGTPWDVTLEALLFDAAKPSGALGRNIYVEYGFDNSNWDYLGDTTFKAPTYTNVAIDYNEDVYALADVLTAGSTIYFRFTPTDGEMRFDNIALTGISVIPEPGSLVALGCLVGSGAFLRTRRRNVRL